MLDPRIGIAITFFVSGFVSLTMQVAWRKALSQTIGVDFFSTTLVVTIFMLGLALGAEVGKRCLRRMNRPLLAFAAAEAFVTLFGLVSIPLIRLVPEISLALGTGISIQGYVADFAVNALLLLLPTIAMGVSFPIIVHYFRQVFAPGAAVGFLYSANIFGAATGAFVSGMLLIGTLGLIATVVFASLLNLIQVAYIGALMWRRADIEMNRPVGAAISASQPRFPVLATAFAIGFIALTFEMVFVRSAIMYFTANNYVFPLVVTCYLVLMALGNNVAGNLLNRGADPRRLFLWAAIVASGTILISLYLPTVLTSAGISLESLKIFQPDLMRGNGWILIASMIAVSLVMMLPVAAVSAMFPVFVHAITSDRDKVGENVATVYVVQTIGNVTGAAIAGFVILPLIGAVLTLQLCAAAIVLCAALFVGRFDVRAAVAAVVAALCFAITPAAYYSNVTYYGKSPTRFSEEIEGIALKYDTSSSTSINIGAERSTSFSTSPTIQNAIDDTIPRYEAVAGKRIESALIIGIGTSSLALQIRHRNPDAKIVIVELLDVVIREMQERGSPAIKKLLQTSRVHVTDGRRYVAKQAIPIGERFDFIQIGVFHVQALVPAVCLLESFRQTCVHSSHLTALSAIMPTYRP